jgi:hypothetical protein
VDAIAVVLARSDTREVAMPVERRALVQLDALLPPMLVEEAELDAVGVLGEEREVRPVSGPSGNAGPGQTRRSGEIATIRRWRAGAR